MLPVKPARFQHAFSAALAGLCFLHGAAASQAVDGASPGEGLPSWIDERIAEIRPRVRDCLAGGCAGDREVLWVLARSSGDSRVIRTLNDRPGWMDESTHQRLLSSLSAMPAAQPRLPSDPPEVWKIPAMAGSTRPVVVLEHATGFPGERLLAILAPEHEPQVEPSGLRSAPTPSHQASLPAGTLGTALAAALLLAGFFLLRRRAHPTAAFAPRRSASPDAALSGRILQEAIYRSRSLPELGANLSACISRATGCELIFLEYDASRLELFEHAPEGDGIRAPLSEAGISPACLMPEVPSLRSAILRQKDASRFLAWPILAETPGTRLLGVIVALEPTARLRAAAGVVAIALERAARYHQSILAADAGADDAGISEDRDGPRV